MSGDDYFYISGPRFSISPSTKSVQFSFTQKRDFFEDYDSTDSDSANYSLRHAVPAPVETKVEEVIPSFSKLMGTVFECILQYSLEQIEIIIDINEIPQNDISVDYRTMDELYGAQGTYYEDRLYKELWQINFLKFQKDVLFLQKILKMTSENLRDVQNYDVLLELIQNYENTKSAEATLLNAKNFNLKELQHLKKFAEEEKNFLLNDNLEITTNVGNLKDELNDLIAQCSVQTRFLKEYENSRNELNTLILKIRERGLINCAQSNVINSKKEMRVHKEILSYLYQVNKEQQDAIAHWMTRFDQDYDRLEINVTRMKILIKKKKEDYDELLEEYNKRAKEIDFYLEEKRIKQLEAEELELRIYAATRIQAWWRGIMYRRGLGRWRKKKRGKGNKKGSAKSAKKRR